MNRNFLLSVCAAGMLLVGVPVSARAVPQQSQSGQQSQQAKSVSGTVAAVGSDRKSFTMSVNDGNNKQTMQFLVDGNTQIQGRVSAGTVATVQYQPTTDGQNLALTITPQTPPNSQ
jgi:hypothetical protein